MNAAAATPGRHRFTHDAMACTFGLTLAGIDTAQARRAARAVFDELDRLEGLLSRFIPHSDIGRINAAAPGEAVRVAPETVECLQHAAQLHAATCGAFDIAFRSRATTQPSTPLVFDPQAHAIGIPPGGIQLDLGGLAKGYALDQAAGLLREWGVTAALLDSGQSTVYALGAPPDEDAWWVHLRHPDDENVALGRLGLRDRALSGSGQRLHGGHIIDPRTAQPAPTAAAWALASSAAAADALSTAFMVMASDDVQTLCAADADLSAILTTADANAAGLRLLGQSIHGWTPTA